MAGIGFTLRRLLNEDGFAGPMRAFAYAALISSGPWLSSSATLAVLTTWSALSPTSHDTQVFLAIVSYCFAFSLVGVGLCQMVASRFLADKLYLEHVGDFAPAFVQMLVPLLGVQALVACAFCAFVPVAIGVKLGGVMLYLALNGTWLAMVFLSAAHDYRAIAWAFGGGWVLSLAGGLWGAGHGGLLGEMLGYSAGTLLTFFVLLSRLDAEFGLPTRPAPDVQAYFKRFWPLAVTGCAYNAGIWIDKIIFWYAPGPGESIAGALHAAPVYDNAMFLAYLTIVPALAIFLLKVETDFYDQYRGYFSTIAAREGLGQLLAAKAQMLSVLRESLGTLIKIQGSVSLLVILLAPELAGALKLSWLSVFVFRAGVFGAFLHALHLIVMILLLYFDFRSEALALSLVFLASNTLFTLVSLGGGLQAYGFGYALSCALTLFVGLVMLDRNLRNLEYHVFMKQPL